MGSKDIHSFFKKVGFAVAISLTVSGTASAFRLVDVTTSANSFATYDRSSSNIRNQQLKADTTTNDFFSAADGPNNGRSSYTVSMATLSDSQSLINISEAAPGSSEGQHLLRFGFNWGSGGNEYFDLLDKDKVLVKRVYRRTLLPSFLRRRGTYYSFDFNPADYQAVSYIDLRGTSVSNYTHLISPEREEFPIEGRGGDSYTAFNAAIARGDFHPPTVEASEPGTAGILLAGLGLMGIGLHRRKKKKHQEKG